MSPPINESHVELAALDWLADVGWATAHEPYIAPGMPGAERDQYGEVVLAGPSWLSGS